MNQKFFKKLGNTGSVLLALSLSSLLLTALGTLLKKSADRSLMTTTEEELQNIQQCLDARESGADGTKNTNPTLILPTPSQSVAN